MSQLTYLALQERWVLTILHSGLLSPAALLHFLYELLQLMSEV